MEGGRGTLSATVYYTPTSMAITNQQLLISDHPGRIVFAEDEACYICLEQFTFFVRRHHCRACGRSCCYRHSGRTTRLHHKATEEGPTERVCDLCIETLESKRCGELKLSAQIRRRGFGLPDSATELEVQQKEAAAWQEAALRASDLTTFPEQPEDSQEGGTWEVGDEKGAAAPETGVAAAQAGVWADVEVDVEIEGQGETGSGEAVAELTVEVRSRTNSLPPSETLILFYCMEGCMEGCTRD